jgi:hypothetical protein
MPATIEIFLLSLLEIDKRFDDSSDLIDKLFSCTLRVTNYYLFTGFTRFQNTQQWQLGLANLSFSRTAAK